MAVTPTNLGEHFPEFASVVANDPAFVTKKIEEATRRVSAEIWDPHGLTDDGIRYLTAHLIAMSPLGEQAKLDPKDGLTTYEREYQRLVRVVATGACKVI